ncbi:MAG: tripartite tricarboxylate transporter substrate binding protein [Burkholderiaceae bacterium]|nr:tripartite tricarboxylate transporter substrate binding protein [Burkholderiaceae bacterium]
MKSILTRRFFCGLLICAAPTLVAAQGYPNKPVTLVVPYATGGVTDVAARLVAQRLSIALGAPVIVENKGGAGTRIGAEAVARALPDGYTLLFANSVTHGTLSAITKVLRFDPIKDFVPVAQLTWYATTVLCNLSLPANNIAELIALAKKNPGKVTHANAGPGSGSHFSGELFSSMAGVNILQVPYKGLGPAMVDVMAGVVNCTHEGSAKPYLDSGKVKALATTGLQRDPRFPDLPTVHEAGVKGYDMTWWQGIVAPAGTPPEIVTRLVQAVHTIANDAEFKAAAYNLGLNVKTGTPAELAKLIADDIRKYQKIAVDANLTVE